MRSTLEKYSKSSHALRVLLIFAVLKVDVPPSVSTWWDRWHFSFWPALCLCTPLGPLCEQHLGVWKNYVPHQSLCTVLLTARLHPHAHRHRAGPTTGLSIRELGGWICAIFQILRILRSFRESLWVLWCTKAMVKQQQLVKSIWV